MNPSRHLPRLRPLLAGWCALAAAASARVDAAPTAATPHPAVVRVVAPGKGSVSYGSGTLVDVSQDRGLVITNWHVVSEAAGPIHVEFPDGFRSGATVQAVDKQWDLAALAVWRPKAAPVPLAQQPPRPGEMLTIAGYGSGTYRAARGRCTQYVAPGLNYPFEMVELAASARQGDSGGPIFNERGELAGVLFGEGHGRTAGSYCGRVRWFVSSLAPRTASPPAVTQVAQAPAVMPTLTAPPADALADAGSDDSSAARWSSSLPQRQDAEPSAGAGASVASVPEPNLYRPLAPQPEYFGWREIAGATPLDQAKTIFAGIGALAILLHVVGRLSRAA